MRLNNLKNTFNTTYTGPDDEFSPLMLSLRDQMGLAQTLEMVDYFSTLLIGNFCIRHVDCIMECRFNGQPATLW